ncbi:HD domain-containing protein [Limnobaculum zhutongyuii]|uniref:HD domain-containing protein n=1 Tax=Limnobaculum zhutongyuii TaxID=2498113 RepID=A0A411WJT9_9GAMM|nr:AAA family ATPase [Limnobaculum zhutongyuii]QBH96442.1 HD domain-containing protein [Limnobaculum zhutongyuii]TQS86738.1 HD domain-containing protein [Limnobaculum zhutongyuii]
MNWMLSSDKSWRFLQQNFSWVADMSGVMQDPIHHAEGDVSVHTRSVLAALISLSEYQQLPVLQQEVLWSAALLHDVEKRSTTRTDHDGHIVSPGHARKGELTTRQILFKELAAPFAIREMIAALVRYHGLPLWVMEKPDPQKSLFSASLRVDSHLLALLAKADVLGRECADTEELLNRIELFELYCHEQQCWRQARKFPSAEARYRYFSTDNAPPDYQPYGDYQSQVTLLSGLPGMGKDSYIQQYCLGLSVISLDDIRRQHRIAPDDKMANGWVVQQAKQQAREKLRRSENFVWNATNITHQMRQQLINLFVSYNSRVRVVYIEVPYVKWKQQNSARTYAVPDMVMDRMLTKLELPVPEEAHEVIYYIDGRIESVFL